MSTLTLTALALSLTVLAGTCFAQATVNPAAAGGAKAVVSAKNDTNTPGRLGWWNDAVGYEIFVRSFADSKTGPLAGDGIGDIQGIIEHLDYLNDGKTPAEGGKSLGINLLWLMPIHPSPSYHGYDVDDYYAINPQYGTIEDFRRLIAECNKRGIRVILDLVLNHMSFNNKWFVEASSDPKSPKRDWFIWTDTVPDWKGPWNQQVWWRQGSKPGPGLKPVNPGDTDGPFYYGIFYLSMPDVNYRNQDASNAMLDVVRHWIEKEGVAGYRLDAIRHLVEDGKIQENTPATHEWLRLFHKTYKESGTKVGLKDGGPFSIGEVWSPSEQIVPYVDAQLDTCFEFDMSYAMVDAARDAKGSRFAQAQRRALELFPSNQYGRFLSNHDQTRIMTSLKGDVPAMRMAASMLLLGPGVPWIYYGEELGMTGDKPDENLRTPMQWTAGPNAGFTTGKPWRVENPDYTQKNVAAQLAAPGSLLNHYRRLIALRKASAALSWGRTTVLDTGREEVIAFIRHADASMLPAGASPAAKGPETVLVVMNLGNQPAGEYALSATASPLAKGTASGTERMSAAITRAIDVGESGALAGVKPIDVLEPKTTYVIAY